MNCRTRILRLEPLKLIQFLWSQLMLLLSVSMSWICFHKTVLNPVSVGKSTYSNKEKFGILEDNLKPPLVHQKAEPHRFSQLRSPLSGHVGGGIH